MPPVSMRYDDFAQVPRGRYNLIMADPPWTYVGWTKGNVDNNKNAASKYNCMTLNAIKMLPVGSIAAQDCILWLWVTAPMLHMQLSVIEAWGFEYKTMGYWAKRSKGWRPGIADPKWAFGTGYMLRCAGEPFLLATRGKPKTTRGVRTLIEGPLREHSRKPEQSFTAAEQLMPNAKRIEVFSRQLRPGWDCFGNETGKFD